MAEKARDPLEIFPAEIWELILEELKKQGSSQDVWNFSRVCTKFEKMLEPNNNEWLFGSISPFIFPYLKGGELLACRKICKTWRCDVDTFLEDFEAWRPFNEGTSDISRSTEYDPLKRKGIKWTSFENEETIGDFLEAMKKEEMKTPFVGRSVSLGNLWRGGRWSQFFEKALELLSLYGDQIWHLHVAARNDDYDEHNSWQFYQILKRTFHCTPKLKSLTLNHCTFVYSMDDTRELKSLLEDQPEISSLETLEISALCSTPIVILEKIISQINVANLKCLKLSDFSRYHVKSHVGVRPLQHLTELHVKGIHWTDLKHLVNNIISPDAPLGKFCLTLGHRVKGRRKEIYMDRVCEIISAWKGTLRMLAIKRARDWGRSSRDEELEISLSKLDALNLKSLELEEISFRPGFIPPALTATLEFLHIRYRSHFETKVGPGMEFYKSVFEAGVLHNSPIWGEMEKLKVIRVQRPSLLSSVDLSTKENVTCTRAMHERGIKPEIELITKSVYKPVAANTSYPRSLPVLSRRLYSVPMVARRLNIVKIVKL